MCHNEILWKKVEIFLLIRQLVFLINNRTFVYKRGTHPIQIGKFADRNMDPNRIRLGILLGLKVEFLQKGFLELIPQAVV